MSKILITGITGFVGASLCKRLRQDGHMLTGTTRTDDLGAGPERVPLYHIPEVGPDTDWTQAVTGADIVVHLVARVHVMKERASDPLAEFRNVNTAGTKRLAEQAAEAGVKRFVFLSSVKVNGEVSPETGFTETNPPQPEDAYGISKWEAEQALKVIAAETGLEVVIIRPPLVYGAGVRANFLKLMQAIKLGLPLPLSAIKNQRSLVSLDNLVALIEICLENKAAANQTFLVSDGEDLSTPELLRRTARAMRRSARLFPIPVSLLIKTANLLGKSDFALRLCSSLQADINKTRDLLVWSPLVSVDESLQKTTKHFLSH